ncbi:MAG: hypothetical protein N2035_02225 [Chthoniobacterales bacterium]|nr:hypothetical protein [Chthoniobacterales bacterium]
MSQILPKTNPSSVAESSSWGRAAIFLAIVLGVSLVWAQLQSLSHPQRKTLPNLGKAPSFIQTYQHDGFLLVALPFSNGSNLSPISISTLRTLANELDKINDPYVKILIFSDNTLTSYAQTFLNLDRFLLLEAEKASSFSPLSSEPNLNSDDEILIVDSEGWIRFRASAQASDIVSRTLAALGALVREKSLSASSLKTFASPDK